MVGARPFGGGTARSDASRLSRHAQRQGRPGAGRDPRRDLAGRVQGRARLRPGAGPAHGARSGCDQGSGAAPPGGQESAHSGRAGRAVRAGERRADGPGGTRAGAGGHDQSGQERDSGEPSACARRFHALAPQDVHRVHGARGCGAGGRLESDPHAIRPKCPSWQEDHPRHQRRRRHQQGVHGRPGRGRRRRACARCPGRRGWPPEGQGRRQCARLAQGGGRRRQAGLARGMGQASRFRRDADQPVPRDPRSHAHGGPRQRHHHPRFRQPTRATAAVLGNHGARLLYGMGQVDPTRLWPRHHHGRQARRAREALRQRDGRCGGGHDRHGYRDRGAQPHRHPHHRAQQRRDGGRARRAADVDQEIRCAHRERQLRQGRGRSQCRVHPRGEARRPGACDQGRRARDRKRRALPARDRGQGRLRLLALSARGIVAVARRAG